MPHGLRDAFFLLPYILQRTLAHPAHKRSIPPCEQSIVRRLPDYRSVCGRRGREEFWDPGSPHGLGSACPKSEPFAGSFPIVLPRLSSETGLPHFPSAWALRLFPSGKGFLAFLADLDVYQLPMSRPAQLSHASADSLSHAHAQCLLSCVDRRT